MLLVLSSAGARGAKGSNKVIQLVHIYARNLVDEAISMKKINNSRLMLSFSSILIDHRRINCSKEALNVLKNFSIIME